MRADARPAADPPAAAGGRSLPDLIGDLAARCRERLAALSLGEHSGREQLEAAAERWLIDEGLEAAGARALLRQQLIDELVGLGPLEPLLRDPRVTEIIVDGPGAVTVEVGGVLHDVPVGFRDAEHVRAIVERALAGSGRRLDDGAPMVDARLADGSRLNAVLAPVAVNAPLVTIRRPPAAGLDIHGLVERGSLDRRLAAFLHAAVLGRCNVAVSGGAGAGKTTLLAALAGLVPEGQRLVVLEDVAELRLSHPRAARLECRPPGRDGAGEVTLRDLVRNSLRMRPDRIVVGEVRGVEAADMVMAMNTGHDGTMTTVHANSAEDALTRLETMLAMAWPGVSVATVQRWIGEALDVVVHCVRRPDGTRVIGAAVAVDNGENGLTAIPLFAPDPLCPVAVLACGEVPRRCLERMAGHGVMFPPSLFATTRAA